MTGRLSCFGWFLRSRGLVAVVAYLTVGMVCAHHLGGDLVTVPFAGSRSVDVGLGPSSLSGILASVLFSSCLLYTSPSPRDKRQSRMPSSA